MIMKKNNVLRDIVFLPKRFSEGNASMYSLIKESGYFEMHNQINEVDIFEVLNENLECIDQWLSLSEDKRSSSGWYFKQNDNGKYLVGHYPSNENNELNEYSDEVEACAVFIKYEIEEIRKS